MNEIKPDELAMICFLVLMQNAAGLEDKAPSYIFEKVYMLNAGYDAFAALDIHNMRRAVEWCRMWHVDLPDVMKKEIEIQEEAFNDLKAKGFEL